MGRKPTKNLNLPPRMRARLKPSGKTYFYYDTGAKPRREIPLGDDYVKAIQKWAELEGTEKAAVVTFPQAVEQYVKRELPNKAPKTQREYQLSFKRLLEFFGGNNPAPLDEIQPSHLHMYAKRHSAHPVQAGRDKAAFSVVFEFARAEGYTSAPNPARGVKFKGSKAHRTVYVSDKVVRAVRECACEELKDALDLAEICGQRPQDTLRMSEADIEDGVLKVTQGKTKQPLRIKIVGRLAAVIERCKQRKQAIVEQRKAHKVYAMALLTNEHGKALTKYMLRDRFDAARAAAMKKYPALAEQIKQFQFRDLRAKSVTDVADKRGLTAAQDLAGHKQITTTSIYVRSRGVLVEPNK